MCPSPHVPCSIIASGYLTSQNPYSFAFFSPRSCLFLIEKQEAKVVANGFCVDCPDVTEVFMTGEPAQGAQAALFEVGDECFCSNSAAVPTISEFLEELSPLLDGSPFVEESIVIV